MFNQWLQNSLIRFNVLCRSFWFWNQYQIEHFLLFQSVQDRLSIDEWLTGDDQIDFNLIGFRKKVCHKWWDALTFLMRDIGDGIWVLELNQDKCEEEEKKRRRRRKKKKIHLQLYQICSKSCFHWQYGARTGSVEFVRCVCVCVF